MDELDRKLAREDKISKVFQNFFESRKSDESRKPYDFKSYNASLYAVLRTNYRTEDNRVDWSLILNKFVPEKYISKFQHTNIYDDKWIKEAFLKFFELQKEKGVLTWSVWELSEYNDSLVMTISKKYGFKWKSFVDREQFIQDYWLDLLWFTFVRNSPIHTKITIERIVSELRRELESDPWFKRSPTKLRPQYMKWFWKKYRDSYWKIDRLYILYNLLWDENIIARFRHRYYISRLTYVPNRTKDNIQLDGRIRIRSLETLNPEEILIRREEDEINQFLVNKIYDIIDKELSDEEKIKLFDRMNSDSNEMSEVEKIISKIKV